MTNSTFSLIKRFAKMSGEQKVRIAIQLSESVRKVRIAGSLATKTKLYPWNQANKTFLSR